VDGDVVDTLLKQLKVLEMPADTFVTADVKDALDTWWSWSRDNGEPLFFLWIRLNNESVFMVTRQCVELDLDPRAVVVQVVDVDEQQPARHPAASIIMPYDHFHDMMTARVLPPLLGLQEVADAIGWDKRKLAVYVKRGNFPEPALYLAAGPVWTRWQVEEFIRGDWKAPPKKRGRPPKKRPEDNG
jgi:hypothetical protein